MWVVVGFLGDDEESLGGVRFGVVGGNEEVVFLECVKGFDDEGDGLHV